MNEERGPARHGQPAGPGSAPRGATRTPARPACPLRYAHRAASVRVDATYHDPARAEGALTAFRTMIRPPGQRVLYGQHQ